MLRSLLIISIVAAVGLIGAGHADAQLDATIEVLDGECDENQNISALSVRVSYDGPQAVEASIRGWTQRDRVRMAWATPVIQPGVTELEIVAPSKRTVFRYGERGQLMLSVGQQRTYTNFRRSNIC